MKDFEIDILIEDQRWSSSLQSIDALASRAIQAALSQMEQDGIDILPFSEVSLAFMDDEKIRTLNRNFRQKDSPTNVLSFPGSEIDGFRPLLGDIVLAYETVKNESGNQSTSLEDHTCHLIIHGFLHLHGFDHQNDAQAEEMEGLEIRTLHGLGINNPYDKEVRL